jgi:pimeloyl-ACP methyl ester carboxylesterase
MPYIAHPSGQTTFYHLDDFTDPWKPHDTILIQHGFARHTAFWYHWIPILAKHYRVLRRDARGHGHSSAPSASDNYKYDIDTILDEIIDTLNQLGIDKVHYLGESTGGIFGEFLAARNPERVHSLAICSSPLYMPAAAQTMLAFGKRSWPDACRELGSRGWGEAVLAVLNNANAESAGSQDEEAKAFEKWWLDQVSIPSGEGLGDHAELLCAKEFDARRVMERIKCPMLLLSPGNSKLVDLNEQRQLRDSVGGEARMEVVNGIGHEIYIDQAERCQELYLKFLEDVRKR